MDRQKETRLRYPDGATRRHFLKVASLTAGGAWLGLHWPALLALGEQAAKARNAGEKFQHLAPDEAADFAAIAAQILPSDNELPGAAEAGVIYFIDRALGGFMAPAASSLREGLAVLNAEAKKVGDARFAELPFEQQTGLLKAQESEPFFQTLRFLTIAGMFAMPSYGGNRDNTGWKLLGFEPRHVWLPPFGHYDAAAGGES